MTKVIVGGLSNAEILDLFNNDLCQSHLGIKATDVNEQGATGVLHLQPWHINFEGFAHGGIVFSALDSIMGMAVVPHLKDDERILAIDLKINYLKGATLFMEELKCHANLVSRTRRLAIAEGEVFDPEGTILSKALGTFAILKERT